MTTTQTATAKPTHRLYCIIGESQAATWIDIGAAWPNKDGKGFSLSIHAMPVTSRIVMREANGASREGGEQ